MENVALLTFLLFLVSILALLSERVKMPLPILQVLVGLGISLIPNLPNIVLTPDIVFVIFLPPLLYSAAWYTSWHDFRANLRPISLAAFGLVFFTTTAVAVCAKYFIPGLSWAECFLLGAIVSPPDAVAANAVLKGMSIHPRVITLLEGESLLNDASGLIAYKYALAALMTGSFILWEASLQFVWVVVAGTAIGLSVAYLVHWLHKNLIRNSTIDATFTLLTPYMAYLLAESVHVSGVLAVVSAGLYLTYRSDELFDHDSRIKAYALWDTIIFMLNGLVFILIGFQLSHILNNLWAYRWSSLLFYGTLISIATIVARFVWVYPAALIPRWLSKTIRERETFDIRLVFVFSWTGMRGVVSVAAALALPLTVNNGVPYENRSLLIFITFFVVLVTLVLQGSTLPLIIEWLRLPPYSELIEEYETRQKVLNASVTYIEENLAGIEDEALSRLKLKYEMKYKKLNKTDLPSNYFEELGEEDEEAEAVTDLFNRFTYLQLELIREERKTLRLMRKKGIVSDEIVRKIVYELDLEEASLRVDLD